MTELVTAPVASALVESDGGGLVVEHEVRSIHGIDAKPCATGASDEWHFAWGTTARESRELLVLFNPFPRSEEHTSELQSLMRISYAVFCLKKKRHKNNDTEITH